MILLQRIHKASTISIFFQTQKRKNKNSRTTCNKHYPGSSDVLGGNWSYRKQSKYFNYLHLAGDFYYPVKLTLYVNFSFPFSMSVCRWPYYCIISFWLCSAGCSWKDSICTFCLCRSSKQTAISESTWRLVGVIFSH